jgi:hypothetical protein
MSVSNSSLLKSIENYQGDSYGLSGYNATLENLDGMVTAALQRNGGEINAGTAPAQDPLPAAQDVRRAVAGLCGGVLMPGLLQNNLV